MVQGGGAKEIGVVRTLVEYDSQEALQESWKRVVEVANVVRH